MNETKAIIAGDRLPTLTAERIALRWVEERDEPALYDVFSDPQGMRYWSTPPWTRQEEAAEYVRAIHEYFRHQTLFQWGIARRSDDLLIGTCTLVAFDEQSRRAEIGYILGRDHWGQGYMGEALTRLFRYAFGELDLRRLEADTDVRNEGSIRILERLGFQREGRLRERWEVAGEIQDSYFYGLLRREWQDAS